jgi:type II secretory pathway component PulJ
MKLRLHHSHSISGATLPEVLIAAVAASIVLGGLMMGSVALMRSFSASDRLARTQSDLHRVADYMARDIRNARSVNATANGTTMLTITAADYYNRNGTPTNLADDVANNPSLGRTGATYGANPVTIRYRKTGAQILRDVTRVDGGASATSTTQIADNVENLAIAVDAAGTATITSTSPVQYGRRKAGAPSPSLSFVMASLPRNSTP